ncbi:MAG: hypothetical protein CMC74_04580 [Flavobacteriaceae bacterium]|nr:hypothetical protein [Flavobacteriaceae bacterium]
MAARELFAIVFKFKTTTQIISKEAGRRSNRHCREILQKIREQLQKESHQSISFCEFADYMGLKREAVFNAINKLPVLMEEE